MEVAVAIIGALLPAVAKVVQVFYGAKVVEEVVNVQKPVVTGIGDDARLDELVMLFDASGQGDGRSGAGRPTRSGL
jgi:hypothetical protein